MDDQLEKFLSAQREFAARVNAVSEDQWQSPTPDSEWSVADLVSHLVEEHRYAAPLMDGHNLEAARMIVDGARSMPVDGGVGANLAEEWREASVGAGDAFSADGALDSTVGLSSGPRPARDYIEEMIVDLVVHSWDLGKAIGYAEPLPDDLVAAALDKVQAFGDMSGSDVFKAPVSVPDDAPAIDRLVALTGRDPSH
jgi:uncharacterized protein (TIGR03086 family)